MTILMFILAILCMVGIAGSDEPVNERRCFIALMTCIGLCAFFGVLEWL